MTTTGRKLALPQTYPRLSGHGYSGVTSSPRGSHPEVCRWRGEVGACGWSYDPLPGGFGAPPWGYYGPCARSSLDGLAEAALSDTAVWRTLWGVEAAGRHGRPALPYKRGPESENRRQAERHGACGRWLNPSAPRPGSMDAARYNLRLAALRCPSLMNECGNVGENGTAWNRRRAWRGLAAVVAGEIGVYAKIFVLKLWNEPKCFSDVASPRLKICRG